MAKKYNHHHKLKKLKFQGQFKLYKCMVPGCTYQVPVSLAENLIVQCDRCEEPMVLDRLALTLMKPHCRSCTKPKNTKRIQELTTIEDFLKEKLL